MQFWQSEASQRSLLNLSFLQTFGSLFAQRSPLLKSLKFLREINVLRRRENTLKTIRGVAENAEFSRKVPQKSWKTTGFKGFSEARVALSQIQVLPREKLNPRGCNFRFKTHRKPLEGLQKVKNFREKCPKSL